MIVFILFYFYLWFLTSRINYLLKINQTNTDIKKKASEDEDFRKLCLNNPTEAIKQVSDIEVPEGFKINIIENKPGVDHTIILPPEPGFLKNEVLDQVAGGKKGSYPGCVQLYCGTHHIR